MTVKNIHGRRAIDSREVAEMVEKRHKHLLRDIAGYIKIMEEANEPKFGPVGTEPKVGPSDFFIPSTYKDSTGRELPCYLITKKGCDMIANKLTGEKGVLFTAAYVTAFEEMQEALSASRRPPEISPAALAKLITANSKALYNTGATPFEVTEMICDTYTTWNVPVPRVLRNRTSTQMSFADFPSLQPGADSPAPERPDCQ